MLKCQHAEASRTHAVTDLKPQAKSGDLRIETLRGLAKDLNAVFIHREVDGELLVDHSGHFALLNPEGKLAAVLQPPHKPEELAEAFERIYEWARDQRLGS